MPSMLSRLLMADGLFPNFVIDIFGPRSRKRIFADILVKVGRHLHRNRHGNRFGDTDAQQRQDG